MNDVEASINLFLQADNYKEMFKGDIPSVVDYILPAIKLNQYRVFRRGDNPYAYTSWAYMNSDTSDKFKRTGIVEQESWWNNGEEVWHIDTIVKKGSDVLPIHRWTSQNIAELKGDKTKINWVRIGMKDNNFYVKKQGHAYARSELNG
jgi:hemolysin-activating ACP:hemolysin acyltransferase